MSKRLKVGFIGAGRMDHVPHLLDMMAESGDVK